MLATVAVISVAVSFETALAALYSLTVPLTRTESPTEIVAPFASLPVKLVPV